MFGNPAKKRTFATLFQKAIGLSHGVVVAHLILVQPA